MIRPVVQFQAEEPKESVELATVALITASRLLGDALEVEMHPLTREQLTNIRDMVGNTIVALRTLGV